MVEGWLFGQKTSFCKREGCKDMLKCINRKLDLLGCEKKYSEYLMIFYNQQNQNGNKFIEYDDTETMSHKFVSMHNLITLENQLTLAHYKYEGSTALI